jgi:hypothetical protein
MKLRLKINVTYDVTPEDYETEVPSKIADVDRQVYIDDPSILTDVLASVFEDLSEHELQSAVKVEVESVDD